MKKPEVLDRHADARFRALVAAAGQDPDDRWIGGYVENEWRHARHIYQTVPYSFRDAATLEFGCNYGATAIVLAALGARVTGVDIDERTLNIARENVARYGFTQQIDLLASKDTRSLPFADASFDRIVCNSVLEYIKPSMLAAVQRELDRVLKPGGLVFVLGTSNRLAPQEIHSCIWLINYMPAFLDRRLFRESRQRGVAPWRVRYGFGDYHNVDWEDAGRAYLEARERFARPNRRTLRVAHWLARKSGVSLGLLTPSISITLRKPPKVSR